MSAAATWVPAAAVFVAVFATWLLGRRDRSHDALVESVRELVKRIDDVMTKLTDHLVEAAGDRARLDAHLESHPKH